MIGQTVSHYRITAKLGEGGMGAVYQAEDLKLQRPVALKFLTSELAAEPQGRQRLLMEARAASRLNHPNIATIYEVGETENLLFIAMELISGETLKDIMRRGVLPASQLLDLARQIAEGMNEAHQVGVLHRDIKPGNIMLQGGRRVKILDFGLAVVTDRQKKSQEDTDEFVSRSVTAWSTGGTVPYMAPEQLRGESTDARADIFSFGVLLYECLTGRLPFPGETAIDILHAILRHTPSPLSSLIPDISPQWERLIDGCLAKDIDQRFGSMTEVLESLPRSAARTTRAEKSVAVLYFENLSKDPNDEYFRDGITEDVITEISKISELRVFPRSAVFGYRDKPVTAPQIGQQLNALYVLAGSLRRAGNRLRITVQLIETRTGHSMWAERYDRQLEDVFAIQDEIAQNIAGALRVVLSEKEKRAIEKVPTVNIQAYDQYLRGRQFFHQFSRKAFEFALQMFRRAIEIDPNYARAYSGIADCYSMLNAYWDTRPENVQQAEAASRKALELDPELAEAHVSRGIALSLSKQNEEAEKEFQTALRLNPDLFEAYYFCGRARLAAGKQEEAAQMFEHASRVRPEDYQAIGHLGSIYSGLGRKEEALAINRRAIQIKEKHLQLHPDDARALYLGAVEWIQLNEPARALEWAGRALAMDPEEPVTQYNVACVYALQGQAEQAIDCLEKALKFGFGHKDWIEHDSDLNSLRSHARFQKLLEGLA